YSTGPDYLRFLQMFLRGGEGVLRPETVAAIAANHIGDLAVGVLPTTDPATSLDAALFPGIPTKRGLGAAINPAPAPDGRGAGSGAWREGGVVRPLQRVVRGRPRARGGRPPQDADPAVRRRSGPEPPPRVRERSHHMKIVGVETFLMASPRRDYLFVKITTDK